MRKKLFIIIFIFLTTIRIVNADSFHLITIVPTDDKSGPRAAEYRKIFTVTQHDIERRMMEIAISINYNFRLVEINGDNFNIEFLKKNIENVKIEKNDIIVFWVISHGFNNSKEKSNFPTAVINNFGINRSELIQKDLLPFERFIDFYYDTKKPRLLISIIDACNEIEPTEYIIDNSITNEMRLFTPNFENYYTSGLNSNSASNFFKGTKGLIKISSTSKGELAAINKNGSVFSMNLSDKISTLLSSDIAFNFSNIIEMTKRDFVTFKKAETRKQTPFIIDKTEYKSLSINENVANSQQRETNTQTRNENIIIDPILQIMTDARNELFFSNFEKARVILLKGLEKYPENMDFQIGVFLCEAKLGYEKFSTIGGNNLYQIVKDNNTIKGVGYAYLQYLIGISYIRGINGFKKNIKEAVYWLTLSFNNGNYNGACKVLTRLGQYDCEIFINK